MLFAATIFLSAFLLFQVQPVIGKYILPWFGSSPGVWTTRAGNRATYVRIFVGPFGDTAAQAEIFTAIEQRTGPLPTTAVSQASARPR